MSIEEFFLEQSRSNELNLTFSIEPVSVQNANEKKLSMRADIHKVTAGCPFLITGPVFVEIDYYCGYLKRLKNHGVYDLDNILKPLLDSLSGLNGILLDDTQVERVSVNWIDSPHNDEVHIGLRYLPLYFVPKAKLIVYKQGNWCWPFLKEEVATLEVFLQGIFKLWNKIQTEDDFQEILPLLPQQRYNKLKDKGYEFHELASEQLSRFGLVRE